MEYIELDSESDSESNEKVEIREERDKILENKEATGENERDEEGIVPTCCGLSWINLWFGS